MVDSCSSEVGKPMATTRTLDCIVIGYNERDFHQVAVDAKRAERFSGVYNEIKTNSVVLDGERMTYPTLLSRAVHRATGRDPELNVFRQPSFAVCYLTSFLRRKGHAVELVNFFTMEKPRLLALLADKPKAVAITTTFYIDAAPISEIVSFVREHAPDTRIIVGGPHIYNTSEDYDPETQGFIYEQIGADVYVLDSQGEATLDRVLTALKAGGGMGLIPNLVHRTRAGFSRTAREAENNNLDAHLIDWTTFDPSFYTPTVYIRTARSCPFSCAFCNYPTMAGEHVTASEDPLITEMRYLHERGVKNLVFVDDTFNVPLPRFKSLLRKMIAAGFGFRWVSFFRCSNADDEAFELMQRSGCLGVFLGIESGDQQILNAMNKNAKLDRYRHGIKKLNEYGIVTFAAFIVGYPGETEQSARNTLEFIESTQPTFYTPQLYYHDLRSPIHARASEFQLTNSGYSWTHRGMDWKTASSWVLKMIEGIPGSVSMPLYAMSLWGIVYLVDRGFSIDMIQKFGQLAREMLVAGYPDRNPDQSGPFGRLVDLIRTTTPGALPRVEALA
jgi:radical SAM PhpK family P-methyltransferase